jgi:hypothetical protein
LTLDIFSADHLSSLIDKLWGLAVVMVPRIRPDLPDPTQDRKPVPGTPTNGPKSKVSGGGGERDSHHTHNPRLKGAT